MPNPHTFTGDPFEHAPSNDSTPSPCVTEHPRQNAGYQRNLFDDIEDEKGTI